MRVIIDAIKVSDSVARDNEEAKLVIDDLDGRSAIQMELVHGEHQSGDVFRVSLEDLKRALRVME